MKTRQFNNSCKFILYFMAIVPFNLLYGAFESYPTSTVNLAFGRIYMNCQGNIIDIINEPSSIINFNMKGGEVIWNRPFQINELQQTVFAAGFMYKNWGFGISASTFGNNIYNESMLVLSVA